MSSLTISGWNSNDVKVELNDIIETFKTKTISDLKKLDRKELMSALNVTSCIYLDKDREELKSKAFKLAEMLEFLTTDWCGYARDKINNSILDNSDGYEYLIDEINQYFENKFNKYGFNSLRTNQTFNTKTGNYLYSHELNLYAFTENVEAGNFLIFAEMFIKTAFDFIDAMDYCYNSGMYSSVEEYFDYLIETNSKEWGTALIKQRKLEIGYQHVDDQILDLTS